MSFELLLREYTALKAEQSNRIGFRDNLMYVNMLAVGAVFSFSIAHPNHAHSLLVIPWICTILGWNYLVNDQHISRLGKFFRTDMKPRIRFRFPPTILGSFNWEPFHRADEWRKTRKWTQVFVDELTFIVPAAVALIFFLVSNKHPALIVLWILEFVMMVMFAIKIWAVADVMNTKDDGVDPVPPDADAI